MTTPDDHPAGAADAAPRVPPTEPNHPTEPGVSTVPGTPTEPGVSTVPGTPTEPSAPTAPGPSTQPGSPTVQSPPTSGAPVPPPSPQPWPNPSVPHDAATSPATPFAAPGATPYVPGAPYLPGTPYSGVPGGSGWGVPARPATNTVSVVAVILASLALVVGVIALIVGIIAAATAATSAAFVADPSLGGLGGYEEFGASAVLGEYSGTTEFTGVTEVEDLFEGACFTTEGIDSALTADVTLVDCAEPHGYEVYALSSLPDGEFIGEDAVYDETWPTCEDEFATFVGVDYYDSAAEYGILAPTDKSWADGERRVVCFAFSYSPLREGTLRDSGE